MYIPLEHTLAYSVSVSVSVHLPQFKCLMNARVHSDYYNILYFNIVILLVILFFDEFICSLCFFNFLTEYYSPFLFSNYVILLPVFNCSPSLLVRYGMFTFLL